MGETTKEVTLESLKKDVEDLTLAVDQLCHYIPINQNILMATLRLGKVSPRKVAEAIFKPEVNKEFEEKVDKEIKKLEIKHNKELAKVNDELLNREVEQ